MNINKKIKNLEKLERDLENLRNRDLPVKAGALAVSHFQENFRRGGYRDGSFTPWPVTKRQKLGGKGVDSENGPLLSGRKILMRSINSVTSEAKVTVRTDVVYARIHNEGGTISHRVTERMRIFAWRKYFKAAGIRKTDSREVKREKVEKAGEDAKIWKGLALTKKTSILQPIPRRQFMGDGEEIRGKIREMVKKEIKKITNIKY